MWFSDVLRPGGDREFGIGDEIITPTGQDAVVVAQVEGGFELKYKKSGEGLYLSPLYMYAA